MSMHPDFRAGMDAHRRGEPFEPAANGQWRRGWQAAQDGAERRALALTARDKAALIEAVRIWAWWGFESRQVVNAAQLAGELTEEQVARFAHETRELL